MLTAVKVCCHKTHLELLKKTQAQDFELHSWNLKSLDRTLSNRILIFSHGY